jgi:hypothetical protein
MKKSILILTSLVLVLSSCKKCPIVYVGLINNTSEKIKIQAFGGNKFNGTLEVGERYAENKGQLEDGIVSCYMYCVENADSVQFTFGENKRITLVKDSIIDVNGKSFNADKTLYNWQVIKKDGNKKVIYELSITEDIFNRAYTL